MELPAEKIAKLKEVETKNVLKLNTPRKVRQATLHQPIFWAGGKPFGGENNLDTERYPGLEILWIPGDGMLLNYKGETFTVGASNVIGCRHF